MLAGAAAWTISAVRSFGHGRTGPLYAAPCRFGEGRPGAVILTAEWQLHRAIDLTSPAHSVLFHPDGSRVVCIGRGPGAVANIVGLRARAARLEIRPATHRVFTGHGTYSDTGKVLHLVEENRADGKGFVATFDSTQGYRRIGTSQSHGIGPHQVVVLREPSVLAVCNSGRMLGHGHVGGLGSVAVIDAKNGVWEAQYTLPQSLPGLAPRHLAKSVDGTLVFGCRASEAGGEGLPLVGRIDAVDGLQMYPWSSDTLAQFDNRISAVAVAPDGRHCAFTSETGHSKAIVRLSDGHIVSVRRKYGVSGVVWIEERPRTVTTLPGSEIHGSAPVQFGPHLSAQQ